MGVWIEINNLYVLNHTKAVTPCVGVWIEIIFERFQAAGEECHSLCGSVD